VISAVVQIIIPPRRNLEVKFLEADTLLIDKHCGLKSRLHRDMPLWSHVLAH
jgi:hypothetical protein